MLAIACLLAAAALTGCGRVAVQVRGISPLNLNPQGESTPVDVRFYQLRRSEKFLNATVEQLWLADHDALGTDRLADPAVATVYPGGPKDEPAKVDCGAKQDDCAFVGVLALYRTADARDARVLVLPLDQARSRVLEFTGYGVRVATDRDDVAPAARGAGR